MIFSPSLSLCFNCEVEHLIPPWSHCLCSCCHSCQTSFPSCSVLQLGLFIPCSEWYPWLRGVTTLGGQRRETFIVVFMSDMNWPLGAAAEQMHLWWSGTGSRLQVLNKPVQSSVWFWSVVKSWSYKLSWSDTDRDGFSYRKTLNRPWPWVCPKCLCPLKDKQWWMCGGGHLPP